ncbi:MAG: hypothetical protein V8S42_08480 [Lachnospiraceae bacterium]
MKQLINSRQKSWQRKPRISLICFLLSCPRQASILFIDNTEKKIPIKLHQVTFGEEVAAQITSTAEEEQIDAVEASTGDVTDDQVIQEVTDTTSISDGLSGIYTETQFSFEAGYKEYKDFSQLYPDLFRQNGHL